MAKILKKSNMQDRISTLPDPMLHHIFCFLSTQEVVQTCVLSKRWTKLWSSVPFLSFVFDPQKQNQNLVSFTRFVDSVLLNLEVANIHKFGLRIPYVGSDERFLDRSKAPSWITFAFQHNVEILQVDIRLHLRNEEFKIANIFTCPSLKVLKLKLPYTTLKFPSSVSLPNLQILHLNDMKFEDHGLVSQIISSFPRLHTLSISSCDFENELLTISHCQLAKLVFRKNNAFVNISTPRIISLDICLRELWSIDDCPSLVDGRISIVNYSSESMEQLVRALKIAKSLELRWNFIKACSIEFESKPRILEWMQSPFVNLKILKLETWFTIREVEVIKNILRFTPNIETFGVENLGIETLVGQPQETVDCGTERTENGEYEYDLSRLKVVQFEVYEGYLNEEELLEFFIEEALNLKKLIITPQLCEDSEEEEELERMSTQLSGYPRVSKVCLEAGNDDHTSRFCVFF